MLQYLKLGFFIILLSQNFFRGWIFFKCNQWNQDMTAYKKTESQQQINPADAVGIYVICKSW